MNLKNYLESDIIDFELRENIISKHKDLLNKNKGIRSYMTSYASYLINFTDKIVTMVNVFEKNFKEIKAFKIICEYYGFKFKVELLNFENASQRDNIIQTIKFHVVMEILLKNRKNKDTYDQLINSQKVIKEAKKRFKTFLNLKEYNNFAIVKI